MGVLGGWFIAVGDLRREQHVLLEVLRRVRVALGHRHRADQERVLRGRHLADKLLQGAFTAAPAPPASAWATTESFVASFVAILVLDFFLAVTLTAIAIRIWGFRVIF